MHFHRGYEEKINLSHFWKFFYFGQSNLLRKNCKLLFYKVFLKIDIEGSEYDILEDILKVQNKISALIIEFHDINKYRTVIENFIKRLELNLTHIHPNNYGKLDKNNDPIIIELSFEKNPKIIGGEVKLPNKLDQKNNPKKNDIFIKFNNA